MCGKQHDYAFLYKYLRQHFKTMSRFLEYLGVDPIEFELPSWNYGNSWLQLYEIQREIPIKNQIKTSVKKVQSCKNLVSIKFKSDMTLCKYRHSDSQGVAASKRLPMLIYNLKIPVWTLPSRIKLLTSGLSG